MGVWRRWWRAVRCGGLAGLACSLVLLGSAAGVRAEDHEAAAPTGVDWGAATLDVAVVRPISFVQTTVGSVLFLAALPLLIPSGRDGFSIAYETFVEAPADETFSRPLGSF